MPFPKLFKVTAWLVVSAIILLVGARYASYALIQGGIELGTRSEFSNWREVLRVLEKEKGFRIIAGHGYCEGDLHCATLHVVADNPEIAADLANLLAHPCQARIALNYCQPGAPRWIAKVNLYYHAEWQTPCITHWDVFPIKEEVRKSDGCASSLWNEKPN